MMSQTSDGALEEASYNSATGKLDSCLLCFLAWDVDSDFELVIPDTIVSEFHERISLVKNEIDDVENELNELSTTVHDAFIDAVDTKLRIISLVMSILVVLCNSERTNMIGTSKKFDKATPHIHHNGNNNDLRADIVHHSHSNTMDSNRLEIDALGDELSSLALILNNGSAIASQIASKLS